MRTTNLHNVDLGIISIVTIIAASIVSVVTIIEVENFGIAQGQGSGSTSSLPSLTPDQKAAMCNPNNPKLKVVNTTESKICGIPVTVPPHVNSSNMTTGAQAPPPDNSSG